MSRANVKPTNGSFANYLAKLENSNTEAVETVKAMLAIKPNAANALGWRGLIAVPPTSPLEHLLSSFRRHSDIPLEMPFFCFLHFLSGWLLQNRVKIKGGGVSELYPELWTIILAPSGSGKTMAHDLIAKSAPVQSTFPEPNSGARFIEALSQNNFSLWFQDEIAQKLKQIDTPNGPLSDIKEYLLRAYGNNKIERSTMKQTITVDEPCLGILGLNTRDSFMAAMSPESLTDGFAQRFCYVVAERDPDRPMTDYPIYNEEVMIAAAKHAFERIQATPLHPVYSLGPDAVEAFKTSFSMLFTDEIPASFYRRVLFRAFKYALYYHLILCKESDTLDAVDVGWAARLAAMHLQDVSKLLNKTNLDGIGKLVASAKKIQAKLAKQGKSLTARDLRNGISGIDTNEQALAIMSLLDDSNVPTKKVSNHEVPNYEEPNIKVQTRGVQNHIVLDDEIPDDETPKSSVMDSLITEHLEMLERTPKP
jgi:hypothetical protein